MQHAKLDENVIVLGWVSFFTDMASAMVTPLLPIFLLTVLHEGADKVGLVVAIATFASYALRLVSGYLSDRLEIVKPFVVAGYALSALCKPLFGIAHSWYVVAGITSAERLGKALRAAPKDMLIASYSEKKKEGYTFGFHKMMDIGGEFTGALLLFLLLWYFGQDEQVIRNIFIGTAFPGVIGVVLVLFFVKEKVSRPLLVEKQTTRVGLSSIVQSVSLTPHDLRLMPIVFVHALFLFFMMDSAFYTLSAQKLGVHIAVIPLLFMLSNGVQTLVSLSVGRHIDRYSPQRVLLYGYACGVVAQLLLLVGFEFSLWLAYGFLGLFTVVSLTAMRALIAQEAESKGAVYGMFYAGIAVFASLGAYASGLIWQQWGHSAAILFSVIGTTVMLIIFVKNVMSTRINDEQIEG